MKEGGTFLELRGWKVPELDGLMWAREDGSDRQGLRAKGPGLREGLMTWRSHSRSPGHGFEKL